MAKSLDQRFGDVLKSTRERLGLTQEDIPAVGRTYLSELERGLKTPTLETIVRLATALGVTPAYLVERATAPDVSERPRRDGLRFLLATERPANELSYATDGRTVWSFDASTVRDAVADANHILA